MICLLTTSLQLWHVKRCIIRYFHIIILSYLFVFKKYIFLFYQSLLLLYISLFIFNIRSFLLHIFHLYSIFYHLYFIIFITIDKISSLSCQKVAYSITSPKIGGNAAKQTSVLLRNTSEYIRCYPSSYCTV